MTVELAVNLGMLSWTLLLKQTPVSAYTLERLLQSVARICVQPIDLPDKNSRQQPEACVQARQR